MPDRREWLESVCWGCKLENGPAYGLDDGLDDGGTAVHQGAVCSFAWEDELRVAQLVLPASVDWCGWSVCLCGTFQLGLVLRWVSEKAERWDGGSRRRTAQVPGNRGSTAVI